MSYRKKNPKLAKGEIYVDHGWDGCTVDEQHMRLWFRSPKGDEVMLARVPTTPAPRRWYDRIPSPAPLVRAAARCLCLVGAFVFINGVEGDVVAEVVAGAGIVAVTLPAWRRY